MLTALRLLKPYMANIFMVTTLIMGMAFLFGSHLLSMVVGVLLVTPLSIAILGRRYESSSRLVCDAFSPKALYYSVLFFSLWILPICLPAFLGNWLDNNLILLLLTFPLFVVLYAKMAPTFVEIATGSKGKKSTRQNMVQMLLVLYIYWTVETIVQSFFQMEKILGIVAVPMLSVAFVLAFSMLSALVALQNMDGVNEY